LTPRHEREHPEREPPRTASRLTHGAARNGLRSRRHALGQVESDHEGVVVGRAKSIRCVEPRTLVCSFPSEPVVERSRLIGVDVERDDAANVPDERRRSQRVIEAAPRPSERVRVIRGELHETRRRQQLQRILLRVRVEVAEQQHFVRSRARRVRRQPLAQLRRRRRPRPIALSLAIPDVGIPPASPALRLEVRDGRDEPPTRAVDECLCERRTVSHAERIRAQRCRLAERAHARCLVDERDANRIDAERVSHAELGIGIDERERLPGRIQLVD
jgi:hypothetical protein